MRIFTFPLITFVIIFVTGCNLTLNIDPSDLSSDDNSTEGASECSGISRLSSVWANDGGIKVTKDAITDQPRINAVWDGKTITLFGAKNEVIEANLILESKNTADKVSVSLSHLKGPDGSLLKGGSSEKDELFSWSNRQIELFFVRYLKIQGLSRLSYDIYDERHIPKRFRRSHDANGIGTGTWEDRPDHDKYYPDIAVPLELEDRFSIPAGENQSVWIDIYIPKYFANGLYQGDIEIAEDDACTHRIPIIVNVLNFTLPDEPSSKTMVYFSHENVNQRYLGKKWIETQSPDSDKARMIRDRHFLLAHRHKISLIDSDPLRTGDLPSEEWLPRLTGQLFSPVRSYQGPGENTGNNIYSIGTYGSWNWQNSGKQAMWQHLDAWAQWFSQNAPSTETFLYLADESTEWAKLEQWASWIEANPGTGKSIRSFATTPLNIAAQNIPSLDIVASWLTVADRATWESLSQTHISSDHKQLFLYNGKRPSNGSFAIEDDGIALRVLSWAQFKKNIQRWFFWESTYYSNYQAGMGETDVFERAQTFGQDSQYDSVIGRTGWNYSNGDGVLFYPGTDQVFTQHSYGLDGPIASLRLKFWRRGIQDADYLAMAYASDPIATNAIIGEMIPKVLWEYGVSDPRDPTWIRTDISWTENADLWHRARKKLADIILR